ncbi:MAG: bifunctional metallophosphatase/5'-nucleotidase [Elusimicrobia bacterium]|nr:bifunctional metallophosphatase/5'-nucleotidase [Elusimicrobiota bacterium]
MIRAFLQSALLAFAIAANASAAPVSLSLLAFNDVYSVRPQEGNGGMGGMAALLQAERARGRSLTVVAGDFLSPSVMSNVFHGQHMTDLFTDMGVDVVAFGNHEFDLPAERVLELVKKNSRYVWLAGNVTFNGGQIDGARPIWTTAIDGVTFGFLGLTVDTSHDAKPAADGRRFAFDHDYVEAARSLVSKLKASGAQVIIAVTHLNLSDDCEIALRVPGIDLILGGHEHDVKLRLAADGACAPMGEGPVDRGVPIVKAGQDAEKLGVITLTVDTGTDGTRIVAKSVSLKGNASPPSGAADALVNRVVATLGRYSDQLAGKVRAHFQSLGIMVNGKPWNYDPNVATIGRTPWQTEDVRHRDTPAGNFVADSMRKAVGAEIGILGAGTIRGAQTVAPGKAMTTEALWSELPFKNAIISVELTGAQVRAAIANGLSQVRLGSGRFPVVSGIRFRYEPGDERTGGARVLEIEVLSADGSYRALDESRRYRLATTQYMADGGDGYGESIGQGRRLPASAPDLAKAVAEAMLASASAAGAVQLPSDRRVSCSETPGRPCPKAPVRN